MKALSDSYCTALLILCLCLLQRIQPPVCTCRNCCTFDHPCTTTAYSISTSMYNNEVWTGFQYCCSDPCIMWPQDVVIITNCICRSCNRIGYRQTHMRNFSWRYIAVWAPSCCILISSFSDKKYLRMITATYVLATWSGKISSVVSCACCADT